jgi:leucyl-tRNA synthetase
MEGRWHFNTDIAMAMELVNELMDLDGAAEEGKIRPQVHKSAVEGLVLVLSLFAPHVADELWEGLGHSETTLQVAWPKYDPELAAEDELEVPVQVNGRLRGHIRIAVGSSLNNMRGEVRVAMNEEEIFARALTNEKVAPHVSGKQIVKRIWVPNKLVNIVVK